MRDRLADDVRGERGAQPGGDEPLLGRVGGLGAFDAGGERDDRDDGRGRDVERRRLGGPLRHRLRSRGRLGDEPAVDRRHVGGAGRSVAGRCTASSAGVPAAGSAGAFGAPAGRGSLTGGCQSAPVCGAGFAARAIASALGCGPYRPGVAGSANGSADGMNSAASRPEVG